jgi:ketosteroid isomerase-like protein
MSDGSAGVAAKGEDAVGDMTSLIMEHVDAFNAHDTPRLLAGFAADAVWSSGTDVFRAPELGDLFGDKLWAYDPELEVRTLVADASTAAVEFRETIVVAGTANTFDIAAFFAVRDGQITRVKVYREGSADIERA